MEIFFFQKSLEKNRRIVFPDRQQSWGWWTFSSKNTGGEGPVPEEAGVTEGLHG